MNAKDKFEYEEDKDSEEERWKLTFDRHHDFIVDRMSPDFGLIDKLYSKSTITDKEKEHIKAEKTVHERNETIIKYMASRCQLEKLIEALRESDQKHLVKYLENDENYSDEFDGDWPLTEKEIVTIKINYGSLIDLIDVSDSGLLDRLYSTGVINKRQREFISSKSTSYEKNEALLEIVRRESLRSYWQTIKCLHQSNQSHISEILEKGGVAVRVDANLEIEEDMDIGRLEEEIALQINSLLSNRSIPQSSRILERVLELKVIAAKKGHSVSLYFLCNQSNEVDYLEKMATDGRLKEFVQILFNQLMTTPKTIKITLKWTPDVFVRCRQAVQDMKNSWISKISIVDFPLELIDVILEKSYLLLILRQKRESLQNPKDEAIIKLLASVDFCWFQRITRKHFKNIVWSKLKSHYEDTCKLSLIYKNNQEFFDEILQIPGKTDHESNNSEATNFKMKKSSKTRQTIQILRTAFLSTKNDSTSFKTIIHCFDPKDHELINEIVNTGGGAARVEIRMSCPLTKFELIPQQFEDGVKILRSVADRDAVVWIWCYSNNALQKLNNCDGLKKLIEIVRKSVKATSNVLEYKTNIDRDQLKKNLVSIPLIIVDFRTILSFKGETLSENRSSYSDTVSVIDVAKLKMKIYVLCTIRSWPLVEQMICVFEGRDPYSIVEEISLRRFYVSKFKSMVSSVKENCLYVLTSGDKEESHYVDEVLRFEIKDDEENSMQDPSKWLELEQGFQPSVLSISKDEDLMMVSSSSPIILRIYDPDARLRLSVSLHGDIVRTRKAVETSNGNFIIMHSMKRQTEDADNGDRAKETNDEDSIEAEKRALLWTVSEVSRDGTTIIRRFIPQNQQQQLHIPPFSYEGDLCTDSEGRVFVANSINERVIVLDSYLRWIGILIPRFKNWDEMEELRWPLKLFYDEDSHEMIVAERDQVKIFDLIHK